MSFHAIFLKPHYAFVIMEKQPPWQEIILSPDKYNQEARIQAAFHLENLPDDESVRALGTCLMTDPSPIIRHEAAFSLGETAHPTVAVPYLMRAVEEDKNIFVRHEAILALGTLGKKEFVPFIKRFINDPEPEMAESAEIALQRVYFTGH